MPFTHYPKLVRNVLAALVQPPPPDKPNFLGMASFASLNLFKAPLQPGEVWTFHHEAQNFTRLFGTVFCDQSLELVISFSNDEVASDGEAITDENLLKLHYDGESLRVNYDPAKQAATGKFFGTIFGRWVRLEVKNVGQAPTEKMRVWLRGSVF